MMPVVPAMRKSAKDGESDSGDVADEGDAEGTTNQKTVNPTRMPVMRLLERMETEGDDVAEDGDEFADEG